MKSTISTPIGTAPVLPVVIMGFGAYVAWFGVHYWRSDTAWPSDPIKAVLTGKPIPTPDRSADEAAIKGIVASETARLAPAGTPPTLASPSTGTGGDTMTKDQIKSLWTGNGGSAGTAAVGAAIALAESSGRTKITSPNPDGGVNVGLWQLDTKGVGAGHSVAELQDPTTNARVTIMGSANGTKWGQWETYVNGKYREFL